MSKAFQIKGFPDYYITDTGDVYSRNDNKSGRIKKRHITIGKNGYAQVILYNNGHTTNKSVHRLVAEAFIPNPENKPEVNHKDGNKLNNNVSNLEWCSHSENQQHRYRVLKHNKSGFGKNNNYIRTKSKAVLQIKDGIVIAEYKSVREAARATNIYHGDISAICRKEKYHKTARGYIWKYKEVCDKV